MLLTRKGIKMRNNYLLRRIGIFVLAVLLLPGMAMLNSASVQAQGHGGGGHGGGGMGHGGGGFHGGGFHAHDRGFRNRGFIGPRFGFGFGYPYDYYDYPYGYYGYSSKYVFANDADAKNQGYQDGLKTGSDDQRRGQSYDPERSHFFKDADSGNYPGAYREGFSSGYQAGYPSGTRQAR
jgi:hypothetical protein